MARLDKLPAQHIIDGFKGVVDFYEYKGIPCARMWPTWRPRKPTAIEKVAQDRFRYINQLTPQIQPIIRSAYQEMARRYYLTWKDWIVRGYLSGIHYHELDPEYFFGQHTAAPVQITNFNIIDQGATLKIEWWTDVPCGSVAKLLNSYPTFHQSTLEKRGVTLWADYWVDAHSYEGWNSFPAGLHTYHYFEPWKFLFLQTRWIVFIYHFYDPKPEWVDVWSPSTSALIPALAP